MRRMRLAVLPAAILIAAGLPTTPAATAAEDVSDACPKGTINSEYVGGDDFAPDTAASATWESKPAGLFEVRHGGTSDGWHMHGSHPDTGAAVAMMTSRITLPQRRQIMLEMWHSYDLASGARAWVEVQQEGSWGEMLELTGSVDGRGEFVGMSGPTASRADISELAGKTISLRLRLGAPTNPPAPAQSGWDIDGITIHTCDGESPSAPTNVQAQPGYTQVLASWEPPGWRPEVVDGYRVRLVDVADPSRNRVVDLPPDARQHRFTDVTPTRSYRVEVEAAGQVTASGLVGKSSIGMTGAATRTIVYQNYVDLYGPLTCDGRSFAGAAGVTVLLQRRYSSAASWVNYKTIDVWRDNWGASVQPNRHTQYRALFRPGTYASRTCMGRISTTKKVYVRPYIGARSNYDHYLGEPVIVRGSVYPWRPGRTVHLERYTGTRGWYRIDSQRLSSTSNFRFSVSRKPGDYTYRVVLPESSDLLKAVSNQVRLKVYPWER